MTEPVVRTYTLEDFYQELAPFRGQFKIVWTQQAIRMDSHVQVYGYICPLLAVGLERGWRDMMYAYKALSIAHRLGLDDTAAYDILWGADAANPPEHIRREGAMLVRRRMLEVLGL